MPRTTVARATLAAWILAAAALVCACDYSSHTLAGDAADDPASDSSVDSHVDPLVDTPVDTFPETPPDTMPDSPWDLFDGPECGNWIVEAWETCDGDSLPCALVDEVYVSGDARCRTDCLGYDDGACLTREEMADLIQRAACITDQAMVAVLGLELVGMYEWEVKAVIDASFAASGADPDLAFDHIVASGPNAIELHYAGGDRMIQDGDLVLIDIGAKFSGYSGDISRTFPANGTFTARQRDLYQLVLDAQVGSAAAMRPGWQSLDDMTWWAIDFFAASPLRALDESGAERGMDYFFVHALCHYVGMDVHGGDLYLDPSSPAVEGDVFTIEPGLYVQGEGTGIRIEDDFVLTDAGAEDLCPGTPKTVAEIEAAMAASSPFTWSPDLEPFLEARREASRADPGATMHMDF